MVLTPKQRKLLETLAHDLEPVVRIGKGGITPALAKTVGEALQARELIKVKILDNAEVEREEAAETLMEQTRCQLVRVIGRVLVLYRPNPQRKRPIDLSAPARQDEPLSTGPATWEGNTTPVRGGPRPGPAAGKARPAQARPAQAGPAQARLAQAGPAQARPAQASDGRRPSGKRPPTRRSGGRRPGGPCPDGHRADRRFPSPRLPAKRGPGSLAPTKKPRIRKATPRSSTRRG